jgi:DNA-binding response OmpR family regulator
MSDDDLTVALNWPDARPSTGNGGGLQALPLGAPDANRSSNLDAPSAPAGARMVLFVGAQPPPAVRETLAGDGMRCVWARDASAGVAAARAGWFDGAVVDASAVAGGIGVALGELRTVLRCPLIVTTAKHDEIDEIVALECGASAYLIQPLSPRRLHAHLQAQIRRAGAEKRGEPIAVAAVHPVLAGWRLDTVRRVLWVGEYRAPMTAVQIALMQCLIEARGAVVPRARLGAALPTPCPPCGRNVDVYVHRLRKRLAKHGVDAQAIVAIPGHGYLLDASRRHALPG